MTDSTMPAYRVLARKYRPSTFSELIGQETLVRTLSNAIALGRLAHAFVLTGVRGVGKTSTARLLARGLNCIGDDGNGTPTLEPCGQCEPCQAIAAGRHVDVLEIDAASHTGVDDAREIIEGVGYLPVSARYKIYIIDEVHMMSKSAFNALLKTLEEPPDAVKFIFATTEIRKVPVTILSRCQRYDLRRVPAGVLAEHLASICSRESIKADDEALAAIARAAEGSVRDALSLLDQAAAMTSDSLSRDLVDDMLGRPGRRESQQLLAAALAGDCAGALAAFATAHSRGAEPDMLISDLLDFVHQASMTASGATDSNQIESDREMVASLAEMGIARLGRAWQLLLKGHAEIGQAPHPSAACEMLIIRLAHAAMMPTPGDLVQKITAESAGTSAMISPPANTTSANTTSANTTSANTTSANATSTSPTSAGAVPTGPSDPKGSNTAPSVSATSDSMVLARARAEPTLSDPALAAATSAIDETEAQLPAITSLADIVTLAEQQQEADSKLRDDLAATPLVAKILAFFPGAQIDEIKAPTSLATADDALIATDEMTDEEETVP